MYLKSYWSRTNYRLIILNVSNRLILDGNINNLYAHARVRDHLTCRDGGYGLLFRSENLFRTTQELEYLFFCRARHEIFLQNLTLGYMTKTQQHWESEYFFRKKP